MNELYHFTQKNVLPLILKTGLNRGEAVLSPNEIVQGVSLTASKEPGSIASFNPAGKCKIRLTIDADGLNLIRYKDWPKMVYLDSKFHRVLLKVGGGNHAAYNWFFCFETILPERIIEIYDTEEGTILKPEDELKKLRKIEFVTGGSVKVKPLASVWKSDLPCPVQSLLSDEEILSQVKELEK